MKIEFNSCSIGTKMFTTNEDLDNEQAKKYAMEQLKRNYNNCTIEKVYVNGKLVLENVKIS